MNDKAVTDSSVTVPKISPLTLTGRLAGVKADARCRIGKCSKYRAKVTPAAVLMGDAKDLSGSLRKLAA